MKGTKLFNDIIYNLSGTCPTIGINKTLSEHDLKLFKLAYQIISQPNGIQNAYICYKIGLTKDLLMKFFKESCNNDILIFNRTLLLWKNLVFDICDINANLQSQHFIPFINQDVTVEGINYLNFRIKENDQKWLNYKNALIEDYKERLNKHLSINKK